jgi:hypothetical protein
MFRSSHQILQPTHRSSSRSVFLVHQNASVDAIRIVLQPSPAGFFVSSSMELLFFAQEVDQKEVRVWGLTMAFWTPPSIPGAVAAG